MNPDRTGDLVGNVAHPGGFQRKMKADENDIFNGKGTLVPPLSPHVIVDCALRY